MLSNSFSVIVWRDSCLDHILPSQHETELITRFDCANTYQVPLIRTNAFVFVSLPFFLIVWIDCIIEFIVICVLVSFAIFYVLHRNDMCLFYCCFHVLVYCMLHKIFYETYIN